MTTCRCDIYARGMGEAMVQRPGRGRGKGTGSRRKRSLRLETLEGRCLLAADLIAAYGFEEAGSLAIDSSQYGHTGTVSGAAHAALGKFGSARSFDGVNDWITISDTSRLDLTQGMTLEAWVRPTSVSDWTTVLLKERPNGLAYGLYASDDHSRPAGYVRRSQDIDVTGPSALPTHEWSHLAATYNGSRFRLYVNGSLVADRRLTGSIASSNRPLRIGGNSVWDEFFSGLIDEVRVYNRALSAAEIQADMNTPIVAAPDTASPEVALLSPVDGSQIEGTVTVSAQATDDTGVAGVQFLLNGQPLGSEDLSAPYQIDWDTLGVPNGVYALSARARDGAGNIGMAGDVTVTVDNFVDVTPPDVSMVEPLDGAEVSGSVVVRAIASDDVGVSGVQFLLNGVQFGQIDTIAPYEVSWDTTGGANGPYEVIAIARDAAGNATASSVTRITVNNRDEQLPVVAITAPADGATVSGAIDVTASASDNVGIVGVQFLLDGQPLGSEDTTAPYRITWATAAASDGDHVLTARARDAAGNVAESAAIEVTVGNQDSTAPAAQITSPATGATVAGAIEVRASASDNVAVVGVQFLLDGQPLGAEDTTAPYGVTWVTGNSVNGSHILSALARDAAGNIGTASEVSVTVSNSTGTPLTIDGAQRFQTMDGFGVNANVNSWNGGELHDAIHLLADDLGSSLWRVYIDNTDWETTNDDGNHLTFNWNYYNPLYSTPRFEEAWSLIGELNAHGITDGVVLNFMGTGPEWMKDGLALDVQREDEWVEMILSYAHYARFNRGLQFGRLSPFNESDWDGKEGIQADPQQVARVLAKIAVRLDQLGMSDVRLVGPDTASADAAAQMYIPAMLANSTAMAKVDDFGFHNYAGNTGGVENVIANSAYSDRGFWVTEQSFGTTLDFEPINQIMGFLDRGATATMVFKAYDGQDHHHPPGEDFRLGLLDLSNGTYTPRISYDVIKHAHKFIRPGAVRIAAIESSNSLRMYAFQHPVSGQVTVFGRNTSGASIQVSGALANLPALGNFQFYRTTFSDGFGRLTDVAVSGNAFSFTAPANSVFTLVTAGPPDTTAPAVAMESPADGATVSGVATVSAVASDNVAVAGVQFQLDGVNLGSEDLSPPYRFDWNSASAANGTHQIRAIARDTAGNLTASTPIQVTVDNIVDDTAPSVAIANPAANATVSGIVDLQADAADNVGVAGVQFFVNGQAVGLEDATAPFTASWNTAGAANGAYELTARARDAAGNATTSAPVRVNVSNAAPSSLIAAYGFNEGGGVVAGDLSGHGLNGSLSGAAWTSAGRYGGALQFDGTNDLVTVADHALLDLTDGMTIEAWVRPTSLVDWKTIVLKERPGGLAYALYASDNTNRPPAGYVHIGADRAAVGETALALNQWTHLATTYDGGVLRLYVNGTLVSSNSIGGSIITSGSALQIGGNSVWGEFFAGTIDEVRLHSRALSASEIQQDMNTPLVGGETAEGEAAPASGPAVTLAVGSSARITPLVAPPSAAATHSAPAAQMQILRQKLEQMRQRLDVRRPHSSDSQPTGGNRLVRPKTAEHLDAVDFLMRRLAK